jgi:hypothetical protein
MTILEGTMQGFWEICINKEQKVYWQTSASQELKTLKPRIYGFDYLKLSIKKMHFAGWIVPGQNTIIIKKNPENLF